MAFKVIVDAGHGGRDPGAVYNGRNEKDDTLDMAMAVGRLLQEGGLDVVYTRTSDVYDTPYEKAVIGNNSGADLFLSLHRNSTPENNTAQGVEMLVYNDSGLPAQVARSINQELESIGFASRGVIERPNLVVLRRTKMPAVLVEMGFINSDSDNALFDQRFQEVAQGIADGVLKVVNPQKEESLYRVQVGAYRMPELAERLLEQLLREGFPAFIDAQDGLYKVQVGTYENLDNAAQMEKRLRNSGYSTYITSY